MKCKLNKKIEDKNNTNVKNRTRFTKHTTFDIKGIMK